MKIEENTDRAVHGEDAAVYRHHVAGRRLFASIAAACALAIAPTSIDAEGVPKIPDESRFASMPPADDAEARDEANFTGLPELTLASVMSVPARGESFEPAQQETPFDQSSRAVQKLAAEFAEHPDLQDFTIFPGPTKNTIRVGMKGIEFARYSWTIVIRVEADGTIFFEGDEIKSAIPGKSAYTGIYHLAKGREREQARDFLDRIAQKNHQPNPILAERKRLALKGYAIHDESARVTGDTLTYTIYSRSTKTHDTYTMPSYSVITYDGNKIKVSPEGF